MTLKLITEFIEKNQTTIAIVISMLIIVELIKRYYPMMMDDTEKESKISSEAFSHGDKDYSLLKVDDESKIISAVTEDQMAHLMPVGSIVKVHHDKIDDYTVDKEFGDTPKGIKFTKSDPKNHLYVSVRFSISMEDGGGNDRTTIHLSRSDKVDKSFAHTNWDCRLRRFNDYQTITGLMPSGDDKTEDLFIIPYKIDNGVNPTDDDISIKDVRITAFEIKG